MQRRCRGHGCRGQQRLIFSCFHILPLLYSCEQILDQWDIHHCHEYSNAEEMQRTWMQRTTKADIFLFPHPSTAIFMRTDPGSMGYSCSACAGTGYSCSACAGTGIHRYPYRYTQISMQAIFMHHQMQPATPPS